MSMDAREEIRERVRSILERREAAAVLADEDSLVTSGRLNSVEIIEIAVFLETRFGVDFSIRPFDQYDFDSVEKIAALVRHQPRT
jgi:acyl carrier protein